MQDASESRLKALGLTLPEAPHAEFGDHPQVINGASDLLVAVLGDRGRHTRSAVGVASLPFGFAVEVDAIFALA